MAPDYPRYVEGDTATAHPIMMKRADGSALDPDGGETRLYATGFDNGDKPGAIQSGDTRESLLGVHGALIVDPLGNPLVEFQEIGDKCDVGDGRRAQLYTYRIQHVDSGGNVWRSSPESYFVVDAWP